MKSYILSNFWVSGCKYDQGEKDSRMRKVAIVILATILFCFLLCGCNGPAGFQNVENIVSIDYSYNSYTNTC